MSERIFLDANVIFSASNKSSNVARFVEILIEKFEVVTSDLALEEARRNVIAKRIDWEGEFQNLQKKLIILPTGIRELPVDLAEKDVPILSSAIMANCDFLVTGDKKDFGHLFGKTIEGVR